MSDQPRLLGRRDAITAGMLAPLAGLIAPSAKGARRPNLVLMLADDLGYGELGCQGNPEIPTPHIDSLARRGVRFTNAYVTAPFCSPSRAGLLTGRLQTRFGHELNPVGKQNLLPQAGLPASETTMAAHLKRAGYRTALIGKWHLGGTAPDHPLRRGFDEFFGFLHEGHFYKPDGAADTVSRLRPKEPPYDQDNPLLRGFDAVREDAYLTRALAREACGFLDRAARDPFFLYLPFNSVHSPMQAETADLARFAQIADPHRRIFAAMLGTLDDAVGAVLAKLREKRLERDTLVVFLSDNGGPTAELTSQNTPLRGQKGQLYEGGIRVPFVLQYPAAVPGGRVLDAPLSSLDLLPTLLAAAGARQDGPKLDGVNLLPWLRGKQKSLPERALYWRYDKSGALRRGDWKIVRQRRRQDPELPWSLFHLGRDPGETRDLAPSEPGRVAEMVREWSALDREMIPPLLA